jgi:hypothetical protein
MRRNPELVELKIQTQLAYLQVLRCWTVARGATRPVTPMLPNVPWTVSTATELLEAKPVRGVVLGRKHRY